MKKRVLIFFASLIFLVLALALIQRAVYSESEGAIGTSYAVHEQTYLKKFDFLSVEQKGNFAFLTFRINTEKERLISLSYRFFDYKEDILKEGEEKLFVSPEKPIYTLKLVLPEGKTQKVFLSVYFDEEFFYDVLPLKNSYSLLTGRAIGFEKLGKLNKEILSFIGLFLVIVFVIAHYIHGKIRRNKIESFDVWVEHRSGRNYIV